MHASTARTAELPPPQLDLQPWLSLMKSYPRQWQTMVADLALKVSDLHVPDKPKQDPDQQFLCYACDAFFVSASALAAHARLQHQVTNQARAYAYGSSCPSCMVQFWRRPRLIQHLSYNKRWCLERLQHHVLPMSTEVQKCLDHDDLAENKRLRRLGHTERVAERPSVQLHGPKLRGLA